MTQPAPSWQTLARLHRGLRRLDRSERHGAVSALIDDALAALRARAGAGLSANEARSRTRALETLAAELRRRRTSRELDALLDASVAELGRLLSGMDGGDGGDAAPPTVSPG